jgi:hypothetical protein
MSRLRNVPVLALLMLATVATTSSPAMASSSTNTYISIYNTITNDYTSLQNIAVAHNHWASSHKTNCSSGQAKKRWPGRYLKVVTSVSNGEKKLNSIKKHSGPLYADFVKTFTDLVHWMNSALKSGLQTCNPVPKINMKLNADLDNDANALGLPSRY